MKILYHTCTTHHVLCFLFQHNYSIVCQCESRERGQKREDVRVRDELIAGSLSVSKAKSNGRASS